MTDKKITDLTSASAVANTDLLPIVQNVSTTPVTKKITVDTLFTNLPTTASIVWNGDTNIYRFDTNTLKTDDKFVVGGSTVSILDNNGRIYFGTASDTYLRRDGTNSLGVSGSINITNNLYVEGQLDLGLVQGLTMTTASAITIFKSWHYVDTYGGASTGSLVTINGGYDGCILVLRIANSSRVVKVRDGTGNIMLNSDFTMNNTADRLVLMYDGSNWYELCRSDNA
jgi:hypothetical protein